MAKGFTNEPDDYNLAKVNVMVILMITFILYISFSPSAVAQLSNSISITSIPARHYDPSPTQVKLDTPVTWINDDVNPHTVTSVVPSAGPVAAFNSGPIQHGGSFMYTFSSLGIFDYYCTLHPTM